MATANEARGAALRAAREAKPWTQAHLAAVANLHPRTVMRAEAGGHAGAETLMALCDALGIDAASLPRDEGTGSDAAAVRDAVRDDEQGPSPARLRRVDMAWTTFAGVLVFFLAHAGVVSYGLGDAMPLADIIGRNVALNMSGAFVEAGTAVAEGRPRDGRSWEALPGARLSDATLPWMRFCQKRDFAEILTGIDVSCPAGRRGLVVRASGPGLFEATLGPLRESAMRDLAALLPRDPRIRVSLAYGRDETPSPDGMLWTEPAALAPGQEAAVPGGRAYAHVRIEPVGVRR